jgi:hypothetical protein
MNNQSHSAQHCYQITIEGCLDAQWTDWFAGLDITTHHHNGSITILTGPVIDQAALRGLLNQIWDLNLALIALLRLD